MKRKLYDSLMQWKTEENGRTALLMENIVAQMLAASGHKLYEDRLSDRQKQDQQPPQYLTDRGEVQ